MLFSFYRKYVKGTRIASTVESKRNMGLNAAVQALKKAEPLKDKVQRCKDLLNDNDAWVCQQQLQKIYQQVLILDLEYALDRKVEQELWNLGFKNYIATLQSQAKDKKNPKRGESQALLGWCLEAASGFYLTLLQEICTAFDLDLPFRRKGYVYGCTSPWKAVENLSVPHKSSCFYACQYCLVHLGDIARYRNESKQAELFYRHAVSLSPSSGQPYNQLALLEASRGNKLGTVFHYTRSVAVKHPFPVATTNLAKTLSSTLNDNTLNIDGKTKLNSQEYIAVFLKVHGVIQNLGDSKVASVYVKLLTETLTALVATESFSSLMLVQMFAINLYALEYTTGVALDSFKNEQYTPEERLARDLIMDLIAGSLSALLLPVYTIKDSIIDYFALPSIKLCLDWIHAKPTVLEQVAFTSRLQIWPSLCVLLNALQNSVIDFPYENYVKVPLPEDRDLQGFLPLEKTFENLKFTSTDLEGDIDNLNKLRAARILRLGHCLAQYKINDSNLIAITIGDENRFSSIREASGPSNELMKELEELSLNKEKLSLLTVSSSPVLSESASSKGSADVDMLENTLEKKLGILKPQGTLERTRDSIVTSSLECNNAEGVSLVPTTRKPRQNIAMQAIMRRAETEQKQVTFKNVSPVIMEEASEKKTKLTALSPGKSQLIGRESLTGMKTDSNTVTLISVPNRSPLMPFPAGSNLIVSGQGNPVPVNLQQNNLQTVPKEQQQMQSPILPPISQCIGGTVCYQNQSFNVQNPQFMKNFLTTHMGNMQNYQIQGQFPNPSQQVVTQNVGLQQHTLNQNRPVHQTRLTHPISMLQQNIGLAQQNVNPQQTVNVNVACLNMQQEGTSNHMGPATMEQQQQSKSSLAAMSSHNNLAGVTNISPLNTYQKNVQQSPNGKPNLQVGFNQANFGQTSSFRQAPSPSVYAKDSEFPFTNQTVGTLKNQGNNSYPLFHGYDGTDFNMWKTAVVPQQQIPLACWAASSSASGNSQIMPEKNLDNYRNWEDSNTSSVRAPSNSYHPDNGQQIRYFANNEINDFDESKVDQKSSQSVNTGNTYSLFSGNTWGTSLQTNCNTSSSQDQVKARLNQQSLWSGPGPSPLERLLEQQKSLREGGT